MTKHTHNNLKSKSDLSFHKLDIGKILDLNDNFKLFLVICNHITIINIFTSKRHR